MCELYTFQIWNGPQAIFQWNNHVSKPEYKFKVPNFLSQKITIILLLNDFIMKYLLHTKNIHNIYLGNKEF